jgi:hypothetical protein
LDSAQFRLGLNPAAGKQTGLISCLFMAVKTDLSIAKGSSRRKGEKIPAQEELKQANRQVLWLGL